MARIGTVDLGAPLDGVLRGLLWDGVPVSAWMKVLEVDPRGAQAVISGIGEHPRCVAEGMLQAVQVWVAAHRSAHEQPV